MTHPLFHKSKINCRVEKSTCPLYWQSAKTEVPASYKWSILVEIFTFTAARATTHKNNRSLPELNGLLNASDEGVDGQLHKSNLSLFHAQSLNEKETFIRNTPSHIINPLKPHSLMG
ncbi:hypothetical protein CEXT_617251 [Caerostris extrusa]|uniref:Uncharacterized protein n=1 Tax=Caerostris extrusa TaxID=172846 RepID=A0AAV4XTR1_CAEEX|nr:hypothetical protein CEXT_617251 [Caerostris extrusa]